MLALDEVGCAVADCGDLGQGFVVEQVLAELLGAELDRLGDDDDLGRQSDYDFEAGRLVAGDCGVLGGISASGGVDDAALSRVRDSDREGVGV